MAKDVIQTVRWPGDPVPVKKTVQAIRLPAEMVQALDAIGRQNGLTRAATIRLLLRRALMLMRGDRRLDIRWNRT